jgi:hypothetical protein
LTKNNQSPLEILLQAINHDTFQATIKDELLELFPKQNDCEDDKIYVKQKLKSLWKEENNHE